jgi:hypothetical protein
LPDLDKPPPMVGNFPGPLSLFPNNHHLRLQIVDWEIEKRPGDSPDLARFPEHYPYQLPYSSIIR